MKLPVRFFQAKKLVNMKIERVISWFNKHTEELKGEFVLDEVSPESLKAILILQRTIL